MEPWLALLCTGLTLGFLGFMTWTFDLIVNMKRTIASRVGVPALVLGGLCLLATPWLAVSW